VNKPFEWRSAPKASFAVLGDPISYSLSPRIHEAAYQALGLSHKYVAIRVEPKEFGEALDHLAQLGYQGVNLTQPLKELAAKWAKHPEQFAKRVGAANTLNLLDGSATNTDAPGFIDTLPAIGVWSPAPVLVLGAGGAARALATTLADAGHRVSIYNRTPERAKKMVEDLGIKATIIKEPNPEGAALILNTTSAALAGETVPVQWYRADKKAIAYDISYSQELSPFLLQAGLGGLKVVDGLEMLVAQAARSLEWWLGTVAPLDAMRRAAG
jgi:shikimate dehydrogenase